jgi:hypothetical protein
MLVFVCEFSMAAICVSLDDSQHIKPYADYTITTCPSVCYGVWADAQLFVNVRCIEGPAVKGMAGSLLHGVVEFMDMVI